MSTVAAPTPGGPASAAAVPVVTPAARPAAAPAAPAVRPPIAPRPAAGGAPGVAKAAEPTDAATMWRKFFEDWPKGVPTRGVLVNRLDEQVPFKAYMVRGAFVLLERSSPDALGARYLVLPFAEVSMVKFIDPLKQEVLDSAGFRGKLTQ